MLDPCMSVKRAVPFKSEGGGGGSGNRFRQYLSRKSPSMKRLISICHSAVHAYSNQSKQGTSHDQH